jgi:hypothetical protein
MNINVKKKPGFNPEVWVWDIGVDGGEVPGDGELQWHGDGEIPFG